MSAFNNYIVINPKAQEKTPTVIQSTLSKIDTFGAKIMCSDFVTNTNGESWDTSCEKSWVPVHNQ